MVFLQVSPFWGWSTPQTLDPAFPGYTIVTTDAAVELEPETLGAQLLSVRIVGGSLAAGDRLTFEYGAGDFAARVDRYAESESRLWIAVDGDGDGVRSLVSDSPHLAITPAAAAALIVTLPTTARPGDYVRLDLAVVDAVGNGGVPLRSTIRLSVDGTGLQAPQQIEMDTSDGGTLAVEIRADQAGLYRIEASTDTGLSGLSNPLFVTDKLPRVLWADLHGHSGLSDGTGTPVDYFRYARDVAALDVVALTDHDHLGLQPLSRSPDLWQEIQDATRRFHQPGRFVTVLGYEWTNWLHGHRHVLYFSDSGTLLSSVDPQYEHPEQLWDALRGTGALTFAHHSAGEPIPMNWSVPPDPELEPVTEVVSVHGSSEAADSPGQVRGAVPGNFVRDALDRGYRLGLIGSGDSHDGHPGLAGLASPSAGLAALLSEDLTRDAVRAALTERAVYATNGPRMLLHVTLDGRRMGSELPSTVGEPSTGELVVLAVGTQPIIQLDIVRSGSIVESIRPEEPTILQRIARTVPSLASGEYLYVRVIQVDGGVAWSSPFFGG